MEKNEQEFTRVVEKYKSTVYSVCYKSTVYSVCYMFSKDREELDDLFQEVLMKLWKGYRSFRGEADLKTWIYRVSLNCCLNHQKKRRRDGEHIPLNVDVDLYEDISDRALQTRRLYDRISRLGLIDRALVLLWLEGMTYEEIGAVVGISVKNVSFQLYRIKEELKKMTI